MNEKHERYISDTLDLINKLESKYNLKKDNISYTNTRLEKINEEIISYINKIDENNKCIIHIFW